MKNNGVVATCTGFKAIVAGERPCLAPLRTLLTVMAGLYTCILLLRELLFHWRVLATRHLPVPVISLGNLTCGGTGKTPAVIWIVQKIRQLEFTRRRPVILSRGYGGDEKRLLGDRLPDVPHFTHSKRYRAGKAAIADWGKEIVVILDDGFQHRQLARDLNILLVDATCPWGYGYILPRGFLREAPSAARRADLVMITRADQVPSTTLNRLRRRLHHISGGKPLMEAAHRPLALHRYPDRRTYPPETLDGCSTGIFSGIGNPASFARTVETLGGRICFTRFFADHHPYRKEEVTQLGHAALHAGARMLITTAKDAVKLEPTLDLPLPLYILDIRFEILRGEERLTRLLHRTLTTRHQRVPRAARLP